MTIVEQLPYSKNYVGCYIVRMPRFSTKALLMLFGVAAVWMSTFAPGFTAGGDLRHCLLFVALIASATLAFVNQGRRRAFWSAFTAAMLLCGGLSMTAPLYRYTPSFGWTQMLAMRLQPVPTVVPKTPYAPPATPAPSTSYYTPSSTVVYMQPQDPVGWTSYPPNTFAAPVVPQMATYYGGPPGTSPYLWFALSETLTALSIFAFAAVCGYVSAYLYAQSQREAKATP
jgi:hypothetical protein